MSVIQQDRAQRLPKSAEEGTRVSPEVRAEIEAVITTFRQWLIECADLHGDLAQAPKADGDVGASDFDTSVRGMLSEWVALREELKRGVGQGEAERQAERQEMTQALKVVEDSGAQMKDQVKNVLSPLVKDRDRLRDDLRSRLAIQQHNWLELILDVRCGLAEAASAARGSLEHLKWRKRFVPAPVKSGVHDGFDAALQRIDSALDSRGVRRIGEVGLTVDPETMKVVEVTEGDFPPGHVVEVVQYGYVCGNEVIRFAEVKATPSA